MVAPLIIEGSKLSPTVNFNPETGILRIEGRSIVEDGHKFYEPLRLWIAQYSLVAKPYTEFQAYFEYLNSTSARFLTKLLNEFEKISLQNKEVKFVWEVKENDEVLEEKGMEISSVWKFPFEMKVIL